MAGKRGLSMWTLHVQLLEDRSLGLRMSRWMGAGHLFVRPLNRGPAGCVHRSTVLVLTVLLNGVACLAKQQSASVLWLGMHCCSVVWIIEQRCLCLCRVSSLAWTAWTRSSWAQKWCVLLSYRPRSVSAMSTTCLEWGTCAWISSG